jgi:DNA-binding response OmpR family regulator
MSLVRELIVVVEDAEEVRDLLTLLLEQDGYQVRACENGDQAFALIRSERPALVITDLMLGETCGLDLVTRLRSDLVSPIPPVIVCSGFHGFEREALERGAAAFIPKPFDARTILATVRSVLARHAVDEHERKEAIARARAMRAKAAAAASAALRRLEPRRDDLVRRASWSTRLLSLYFGFGDAFVAVLEGDELRVMASSNDAAWPRDRALDLALCRDIMETSSALVVPDLQSFHAVFSGPDGRPRRFFAGVPLANGETPVGALCHVDEQPRRFSSDVLVVLEALGDRATAVLSAKEAEVAPVWTASGLLTRDALCVLLGAELARMKREPVALGLAVYAGRAPATAVRTRSAFAELGGRRYAALLTRDDDGEARRALLDVLDDAADGGELDGAGVLSAAAGTEISFDAKGALHAAEGLLDRALRGRRGTIERVVVRREPLRIDEPSPARP